jgi:hypothetical protein
MNANKVTASQKLAFVEKIIASDVFDSSEVAAVAILQQLVDDAKKEIATNNVKKLDKKWKEQGKMLGNKKEIIQMAIRALDFDSNTVSGSIARELGVKL